MTHPSLLWQRPTRVREELAGCNAAIEDATGEAVKWFRPPFGSRRPDVLRTAVELGLTPVMWNVTAHDWDATDSEALAARVQSGIRRNQRLHRSSNILLHDGGHRRTGNRPLHHAYGDLASARSMGWQRLAYGHRGCLGIGLMKPRRPHPA